MKISYFQVVECVKETKTLEECKSMCSEYSDKAIKALSIFKQSEAKKALVNMVNAASRNS